MSETQNRVWEIHYDDEVPRWRVVTLEDGKIVRERVFHEKEVAEKYKEFLDENS